MSLEYEFANPSDEEIIRILHQRLQTAKEDAERYRQEANNASELAQKNLDKYFKAKEENERLRNLLGKPYKRRIDLENNKLTQQNKQLRENINNIKNLCNEDWEDMTVDKFQNQLLQALKGVE